MKPKPETKQILTKGEVIMKPDIEQEKHKLKSEIKTEANREAKSGLVVLETKPEGAPDRIE